MSSFQVKILGITYSGGFRLAGFGTDGFITLKNKGPEPVLLCNVPPGATGVDAGDVYPIEVGEVVRVADPDPTVSNAPGLFVFLESAGANVSVISEA
jgi:hypothetical protein